MNTNLIKIVLSAALVTAVTGCHSLPEKFPLSPAQKEVIKQNKSPLILVLTADGQFLAADEDGKTLRRCKVGVIATKGNPVGEACQGLQEEYALKNLRTLSVIHSKKNPECLTFIDPAIGMAQEYCW